MDDTTKRVLAFIAKLILNGNVELTLGDTWTLHHICDGDFSNFEDDKKEGGE